MLHLFMIFLSGASLLHGLEVYEQIPLFEWTSLWSELEWIFQNCSVDLQKSYLCKEESFSSDCSCERSCIDHGDCCFDFARAHIHERTSALLPQTRCRPLNDGTQVYMIDSCSEKNDTQLLKSKCEKVFEGDSYNYLMDIPVTSKDGLTTYSNVFCALCHNENEYRDFNYSLSCSNQNIIEACGLLVNKDLCTPDNYNPGSLSWTKFLFPNDSSNNCTVAGYPITCKLNIHIHIPQMQSCQADHIRSCAKGDDTLEVIYCNLYSLPYEHMGRIYHNPHCAKCNGVALEESSMCKPHGSNFRQSIQQESDIIDSNTIKPFQLNFMDIRCEEDDEGSLYFWNSFSKDCYYIHCGRLYENHNGKCEYKNLTADLDQNCHTVLELRPWEVRQFSNGSIHYKRKDVIFHTGSYELYFIPETEGFSEFSRVFRICSPYPDSPFFKEDLNIYFLHEICTSLSLISLSLHVFIHTALKKLRNLFVQNILALSTSLLIHQFLSITGITYKYSHSICIFIATNLHYFQLVSYHWMALISYDLFRMCIKRKLRNSKTPGGKRRFKFYSYIAWGVPMLIVGLGLTLDQIKALQDIHPYYAKGDLCWINTRRGLLIFLIAPLSLTLLVAFILLFVAIVYWIQFMRDPDLSNSITTNVSTEDEKSFNNALVKKLGARLLSSFILYLLMTLVFLMGVSAVYTEKQGFWYPFVIINGLQGIWIFITYNFRIKVYYMIYEKVLGRPHPSARKANVRGGGRQGSLYFT